MTTHDVDDAAAWHVLMEQSRREGLAEVTLEELRTALDYRRLGPGVLSEIAERLGEAQLGFFPQARLEPRDNPTPRAQQTIWIYNPRDPRFEVIDAVLHPDRYTARAVLKTLIDRPEQLTAEQTLERIRGLVCQRNAAMGE